MNSSQLNPIDNPFQSILQVIQPDRNVRRVSRMDAEKDLVTTDLDVQRHYP